MTQDIPRPRCKHGVTPHVRTETIEVDYMRWVPARTSLIYDCPTPWECAAEAYRTTPFPSDTP